MDFYKDMKNSIVEGIVDEDTSVLVEKMVHVPMTMIEKQKELLETGFIGHKLHRDQSLDYVQYSSLLENSR